MGRRSHDPDFPAFPSIPRLHREVVITEKIDGTNGIIQILPWDDDAGHLASDLCVTLDEVTYVVRAGSRSKWIDIHADNHGFANWVADNAATLVADLGEGTHYGEWWGSGINRGYGLPKGEKRFSLFNTGRWTPEVVADFATPRLGAVPVLWRGNAHDLNDAVEGWLYLLQTDGSQASWGFTRPEGIIIYHTAGNLYFKATIEKDESPKSLAGVA